MERESRRNPGMVFLLSSIALGAAAMYFADPERGKRRRAIARDKAQRWLHRTGNALDIASRDFSNRAQGWRARMGNMLSRRERHEQADDAVIEARVRTAIGRAVSNPHAIKVMAYQGHVILNGPVLASEKDGLLRAVHAVPGVDDVEDELQVHESGEHIPGLQGHHRSSRSVFIRTNWPPSLRAAALLGGGALGIYGLLRRRSAADALMTLVGTGMLTRGLRNRPLMPAREQSGNMVEETTHTADAGGTEYRPEHGMHQSSSLH